MNSGTWILLATISITCVVGGWQAYSSGRFRQVGDRSATGGVESPTPTYSVLAGSGFDGHLGERATLLQFSSAFCAPCRVTRRVLTDVARAVPGVAHLEVDAEQHLELVRRLGVLRTPTTLVLDELGREVTRAAGAPRKEQVLRALSVGDPALGS